MGERAREASRQLALLPKKVKDNALETMADEIEGRGGEIERENGKDIELAKKKGLSKSLIDRLLLNPKRIKGMAEGLRQVARLPDPVGKLIGEWRRPNGLRIQKRRVPLGVIGIIYESRPNVTVDASGLCLKSGNACILRGGSEAIRSNIAISRILDETATKADIPSGSIQLIKTTDRRAIMELIRLDQFVDLIIPRGGEGLIRTVVENSTIPVVKHYKGVCHTYVDRKADLRMAEEIAFNAKCQRPGVCNAMETLLVHRDIAPEFLPPMLKRLKDAGVEIRGCPEVKRIFPEAKEATQEDWTTEYLDLILSVKVVQSLEEAIHHTNRFGTKHSEAIITEDDGAAEKFLKEVDAACVYRNASTRFTDGGEFGMGAEIGISTEKLPPRGPMGLEELTSYKFIIYGAGQLRE